MERIRTKLISVNNVLKIKIVTISIILFCLKVNAQITKVALPFSYSLGLHSVTDYVKMEPLNMETIKNEEALKQSKGVKSERFAKLFKMAFSPENSGQWDISKKGKLWRLGIVSENAYSLYLVFGTYKLNDMVNLFVYTPHYVHLNGAYTKKNNNINNVLSIPPLPLDTIIVELNIPNEIMEYGKLVLTGVGHDYKNAFGIHTLNNQYDPVPIGKCYVDINCPDGAGWQSEKKAVCKILVGDELCTGSLIADRTEDKTPYFLTANHCIDDSSSIPGSIFYFNYEKIYCDSSYINSAQTLSGASLVSTTDFDIDFVLLKLNDLPPISYHPFFLGWDWSDNQPQSGTVIHHPNGAVKKISFDFNPLQTGTFNTGLGYDSTSFWEVTNYNIGATEAGSSGAPIFDGNHRVVGSLTGGPASCTEQAAGDYYTRFALAWDKNSNPQNQLKAWLDPGNSGINTMNGYDPYSINISDCDTTWNYSLKQTDYDQTDFPWSVNYQSTNISNLAEKFFIPSWLDIYGIYFDVNKAFASGPLSTLTINIWSGDSLPSKIIYTQDVFLRNIIEKSVNFIGLDSVVKVSGNFFISYSYSERDSFIPYHCQNKGINGPSTVLAYNGSWHPLDEVTSPAMYSSMAIGLIECHGKTVIPQSRPVSLYPNPCYDLLNIVTAYGVNIKGLQCYDITGKIMPISYFISLGISKVSFNLHPGMYFLKILTNSESVTLPFVVAGN